MFRTTTLATVILLSAAAPFAVAHPLTPFRKAAHASAHLIYPKPQSHGGTTRGSENDISLDRHGGKHDSGHHRGR